MRDWLRTDAGNPPAPVRRDQHVGSDQVTAASGSPLSRLDLRARIPDAILSLIVLVLLGAAATLATTPAPGDAGAPLAAPAVGPPVSLAPPDPTTVRPVMSDGDPEAPPPRRVRIDRISVDSPLIGLRIQPNGELEVPADYAVAGWHRAGVKPGDTGPAVLVGHVDSFEGPAVFFRLRELQPGERVVVTRTDGSEVAFDVTAVERYAKAEFPSDAVYGATAGPELRLVTCGGRFDEQTRSYEDNVVVYARQAPAAPEAPPAPAPREGGGPA